jgi:hypothetical protein
MAKSFHSPYISVLDTAAESVTGVIDYIKAIGGAAKGDVTVTYNEGGSDVIELGNGDSVYGPFKSVVYTAAVTDLKLVVHERSKIIES